MNGLLLIGGKSSRMGEDKSEIIFRDGLTQKERGIQLLQSVCDDVYLSTSADSPIADKSIPDTFGPIGPLGAIASAQKAHPDTAWLVLACDLPLLEKKHLEELASNRSENHAAVYYTSTIGKQPEPLCAIWEPSSADAVSKAITDGRLCPRHVLNDLACNALPSLDTWVLANTNTPADMIEVISRLQGDNQDQEVTISYYAQLRELTGKSSETIITSSVTPSGVYEEIRAIYNLDLKRKNMMVAIDGEFTDWTHQLADGEEIVFIPPVAGG